jgi:hypothetical protein
MGVKRMIAASAKTPHRCKGDACGDRDYRGPIGLPMLSRRYTRLHFDLATASPLRY